jgi:hypothetical protein
MKRNIIIAVVLIGILAAGLLAVNAFAHEKAGWEEYREENAVETQVEEIDNGIQITITADDKETAKELKENKEWFVEMTDHGCGYSGARGKHHHGWGSRRGTRHHGPHGW